MDKYKCEVCGKNHQVFRSIEGPLPDMIFDIPEEEKKDRIHTFYDFHLVDKEFLFGKGWILIDMENLDEPIFYWHVWVQLEKDDYLKESNKLSEGKTMEMHGKLLTPLPFYEKANGLQSKIIVWYEDEKINIRIRVQENSQLKLDQAEPITKERAIQISQHIHHPELFNERKIQTEPFVKRIHDEIIKSEIEFLRENKNFAINISTSSVTLFQIISSKMLESNGDNKIGFGLHLSFDDSFEETKVELSKFKSQDFSKEFEYHNLDEIATYQLYLGTDINRIEKLVRSLVVKVYEHEIESIIVDRFEI